MKKIVLAIAAVVVIAVVAVVAVLTLGGDDEVSTRGTCDGRSYELSVEPDDKRLEVTFELQTTAPGETWQFLIEQDGNTLLEGERQSDEDAEIDLDAVANTDAGDQFTVTATGPDGASCTAEVTR